MMITDPSGRTTGPMQDGDRQTLLVLVPLFVVAIVIVFFALAITRDTDEAAAWFTGIGAAVAVVGVITAGVALYKSDVLEKPYPSLWIELPDAKGDGFIELPFDGSADALPMNVVTDGRYVQSFEARIHVKCQGRGVLRWAILTIQVLTDCDVRPVKGHERSHHFKAETPFNSEQLRPGRNVLCHATVVERDFPPGHSFLYSVVVQVPSSGSWPLAAVLDGFPSTKKMTRVWTRADITVM